MVNGNESASPADVKTTLATIKLEPIASSALPWGACLADAENCAVHSAILPRTTWDAIISQVYLICIRIWAEYHQI